MCQEFCDIFLGGLCPRGLCPGGSLSRRVSVQGVSVQGVSVQGVAVLAVSVSGVSLGKGGLCSGESLFKGSVSQGGGGSLLSMIMSRKVTSYWNAFRLDYKAVFSPSESERESEYVSFMFVMYFLILFTCSLMLFAFAGYESTFRLTVLADVELSLELAGCDVWS